MKYVLFVLLLTIVFYVEAQVYTSVSYDEETGNYIIYYENIQGDTVSVIFEPRTKISPGIFANVHNGNTIDTLKYSYHVYLLGHSEQNLLSLTINTESSIISHEKPNDKWESYKSNRIPGWRWVNSYIHPRGLWVEDLDISPGDSLNGFIILSQGIPTIVNAYFEGNERILMFPDEPPSEVMEIIVQLGKFEVNSVQVQTIGPKDPPDPFVHSVFIDSLISYLWQSYELRWVLDETFVDELDDLLRQVRAHFLSPEPDPGGDPAELLETFIDLVQDTYDGEGPPGAELSSEAYALFYYNAKYLLERID